MSPTPPQLPALLLAAFVAAFATQLARQLMKETPPRARRTLASAVAAGIASVSTTALVHEWFSLSTAALLAISCIVGWSGAGVLGTLGFALETRLGLHLPRSHRGGPRHF